MVRLKWLKMRAFRSFLKETKIEFPETGLVLIRGSNPATGDPSGTGKSTIFLAIAYALDMCPYPATELQSWMTGDPMQVSLCLETPKGEVIITRGKKNSLRMGDQTITGAKAISEATTALFGLDADTLRSITYRIQRKDGLFLSLSDSEKKEFLTRILGLTKIEAAVEQAEKQAKLLEPGIEASQSALATLEGSFQMLREQKFPELTNDLQQKADLVAVNNEIRGVQENIDAAWAAAKKAKEEAGSDAQLAGLRQALAAATQHLDNTRVADQKSFTAFQERRKALLGTLQLIAGQEAGIAQANREIGNLEIEMRKTLEGVCPTCMRQWEDASKKAEALKGQIENWKAMRDAASVKIRGKKMVEEELRQTFTPNPLIEKLSDVVDTIQEQISDRTVELNSGPMQEAQSKVNALKVQQAGLVAKRQGLEQQINTICEMNKKLEASRKQAEWNIEQAGKEMDRRRAALEEGRKSYSAEKDFAQMMGYQGFLGVIFGEALRDIEIRTNERLARLANVSNVTLHFKSEVITGKGTVKRAITPVAYVGGHETKPESGLSGGMYTSVEGVVDLAVMAVAQERTGSLPGFMFLDESFNGQGNATKESAMEVLREYGKEKLVMVIDHSSEFKEHFSQFIDVIYQDGVSSIEAKNTYPY